MCCINRHFDIVEKSKNTIAPIEYVPDVILYVDGAPYIRYDGPHEVNDIRSFIFTVYEKLQKTCFSNTQQAPPSQQQQYPPPQSQQQYPSPQVQQQYYSSHDNIRQQQQQQPQSPPYNIQQPTGNAIPAYTIGKPLCGQKRQDRCYLDFKIAYNK